MATISRVRRRGVGRPLAVAAIAIGAMLLGAAALVLRQGFNAPPPYRYEMGDLVPPGDLDPAFQSAAAGVAVHRAVVMSTSGDTPLARSEEHTSELQSLMRISYAVFCLKKKKQYTHLIRQCIHIHTISAPTTK